MTEPLILTDDILNQATLWRDECLQRWEEAESFPVIGEAILISPVDSSERKVVLRLGITVRSGGAPVKGKAIVGVYCDETDTVGDGYTVALSASMLDPQRNWINVLLHEMTHAVDPLFDVDFFLQNPKDGPKLYLSAVQQYHLPSEQRAFSAMWIEELRCDLKRKTYCNPADSISRYRGLCREFDGFIRYAPSLTAQTEEHFFRIVEDLQKR